MLLGGHSTATEITAVFVCALVVASSLVGWLASHQTQAPTLVALSTLPLAVVTLVLFARVEPASTSLQVPARIAELQAWWAASTRAAAAILLGASAGLCVAAFVARARGQRRALILSVVALGAGANVCLAHARVLVDEQRLYEAVAAEVPRFVEADAALGDFMLDVKVVAVTVALGVLGLVVMLLWAGGVESERRRSLVSVTVAALAAAGWGGAALAIRSQRTLVAAPLNAAPALVELDGIAAPAMAEQLPVNVLSTFEVAGATTWGGVPMATPLRGLKLSPDASQEAVFHQLGPSQLALIGVAPASRPIDKLPRELRPAYTLQHGRLRWLLIELAAECPLARCEEAAVEGETLKVGEQTWAFSADAPAPPATQVVWLSPTLTPSQLTKAAATAWANGARPVIDLRAK